MNKRIFSRVKRLATAKIILLVASLALVVMLASCDAQKAGTGPTKPASTSHNGKIAFAKLDNQVGEFDIFVMEPDGSGVRKLATKPVGDNFPAWSSNRKRLAFEASQDPSGFNIDLYVMNADGSRLKRITKEPTPPDRYDSMHDRMPSWSPDGTRIAFTRASGGRPGRVDVFTMNAEGTHLRKLTGKTEGAYSPDFSPDGKRIVFIGWEGGNKLAVMNADGTNVRRLTPDSKGIVDEFAPDWQPLPSS
jgi:Tol biopolymer transport system component